MIKNVHGRPRTFRRLLEGLGYRRQEARWFHPEGRVAVCVGDLVDQGPDPFGCLELQRELVESGAGRWVLGNHEVNLVHLLEGLRRDSPNRRRQARTSLDQIEAEPARWAELRDFLLATPLGLRLEDDRLRVVHACWDEGALARLPPTLEKPEDLRRVGEGGERFDDFETVLKGPEADSSLFRDRFGKERSRRRVRWWRQYPVEAPLVAFGHYRFPLDPDLFEEPLDPAESGATVPALLGPGRNAACVDHEETGRGRLVALRWPELEFQEVAGLD